MGNMKRNFAFWLIILILLLALFSAFRGPSGGDARAEISYSEFLAGVEAGNISSVTIQENNIAGQMTNGTTFQTYAPYDASLIDRLNDKGVDINAKPVESSAFATFLLSWLPFIILIGRAHV